MSKARKLWARQTQLLAFLRGNQPSHSDFGKWRREVSSIGRELMRQTL